jgi:hypothetical protein
MRTVSVWAAALVVCILAFTTACGSRIDNAAQADEIKALVSRTPAWVEKTALGRRLWKIEQAFYESRGHVPAWVDGVETTDHWKDLIQQLKY